MFTDSVKAMWLHGALRDMPSSAWKVWVAGFAIECVGDRYVVCEQDADGRHGEIVAEVGPGEEPVVYFHHPGCTPAYCVKGCPTRQRREAAEAAERLETDHRELAPG